MNLSGNVPGVPGVPGAPDALDVPDARDVEPFFDAMGQTASTRGARSWMPILSGRRRGAPVMRYVLVLQGNVALWTRWQDGHLVGERIERLADDELAATRCPWPTPTTPDPAEGVSSLDTVAIGDRDGSDSACPDAASDAPIGGLDADETFVDVVADSPLDDIERALASEPYESAADRAGMREGMRADDRAGGRESRREGGRSGPGMLLRAIGRRALIRRLAREHRDAAVRPAPYEAAPVLAVMLRSELPEAWTKRLQTLQRGAVTVRVVHSAIRLREAAGEERAGDVLRVYRGGGVERHVLFRNGCPTFTRLIARADRAVIGTALDDTRAHLVAHHGVTELRVVQDGCSPKSGSDGRGDIADARILAALAVTRRPVGGSRDAPAVLDKWARHVELRRVHVATALTALIAGLTVIASVMYGIGSMQRRAEASRAGEAFAQRARSLSAAMETRHSSPAMAEASLALLERRSAAAPDAAELLGSLAGVLTEHPDVRLERMAWSSGDRQALTDDMPLDTPASLPPRRVEGELEPAVTRLEIAGRIDVSEADDGATGGKVRERQARFEAFVGALENVTAYDEIEVRLSPASAAASGESGRASSARAGAHGAHYALRWRHSTADGSR